MSAADHLSPAARAIALDVLALVCWADGRVSPAEFAAVRGAAIALALIDPLDKSSGALVAAPKSPTHADLKALTARERHILFAAAAWVALVDAKRTPGEAEALDELARGAGLDDDEAELLFDIARWVRLVRPRITTWAGEFERLVMVTEGALGPARSPARRSMVATAVRS
jgi:hypothetical protein